MTHTDEQVERVKSAIGNALSRNYEPTTDTVNPWCDSVLIYEDDLQDAARAALSATPAPESQAIRNAALQEVLIAISKEMLPFPTDNDGDAAYNTAISHAVMSVRTLIDRPALRCAECDCEHGGENCNWIAQPAAAPTLVDHASCNGEGWVWSDEFKMEVPCEDCGGSGVDPDKDFKASLIDLIGELGREVFYMLDDCETSGNLGEEIHTITTEALEKVSDTLDRIDALPFEEPGVLLGTGAKLQAAVKQTFLPAPAPVSAEDRENIVDEIENIISETHEMDVRDVDYAENIVSWLERHHPDALRAIAGSADDQPDSTP